MPALPKGMEMPPGYELWGEMGMGERTAVYYWHRPEGGFDIGPCGPDVLDKRKAVRQAWADYRAGGAGPEQE
jgi:hypothetical protein